MYTPTHTPLPPPPPSTHTQEDTSGCYSHLIGIPKALLPARHDKEDTILDNWWNVLKRCIAYHRLL